MKKFFLLSISLLLAAISCNKKSDPTPNNFNSSDIEYKATTIVTKELTTDPVISINENKTSYVFDADVFDKQPTAGQTILVPGMHMRKVVSSKKTGYTYEIETSDAILTDVIKNGTLAYEITPQWGQEQALLVDGKKARKVYGTQDGVIEYAFEAKGIAYKIVIEPTSSGENISSCKFQMQMIKKSGGKANVSLVGEGTATLPKQSTNITIKDGALSEFSSDNNGMSGNINLSISAADGEPGETTEVLPSIALTFPIRVLPTPFGPILNPIPMAIKVGVNFVTSIKFTGQTTSATGKSSISYNANTGFKLNNGAVSTTGNLNNNSITDGKFDSAGFIGSSADVQFGIAFPRVSLEVAGQEMLYVHVGFTTGSSIYWNPLCKSGYAKILVEGGYGLKVLGSTLFGNKITFAEQKREAKGDGCK